MTQRIYTKNIIFFQEKILHDEICQTMPITYQ